MADTPLNTVPQNFQAFLESKYTEMTYDQLRNYLVVYNINTTNISETKGQMEKKVIAIPEIATAANAVFNYVHARDNHSVPEQKETPEIVGDLNKIIDYLDKGGTEFIYFEKYSSAYGHVIFMDKYDKDGAYAKLSSKDRAITDKAVAAYFESKKNSYPEQRDINEQREKIAQDPQLLISLRQNQASVEKIFENGQQTDLNPPGLSTPASLRAVKTPSK